MDNSMCLVNFQFESYSNLICLFCKVYDEKGEYKLLLLNVICLSSGCQEKPFHLPVL